MTGAVQSSRTEACPAGGPPVPNPLFGKARTMFNPRQLQLSAKLAFYVRHSSLVRGVCKFIAEQQPFAVGCILQ
jgi:hypothetical protein